MTAETLLSALVRINLVASAAILVVLALRPRTLPRLGPTVAYWLWILVPVAVCASLLPARTVLVPTDTVSALADFETPAPRAEDPAADAPDAARAAPDLAASSLAELLALAWLAGAALLLARSVILTRRIAADPSFGPALVGVLRPKLILPEDFDTRFDTEEQVLILAHEDVHRASRDSLVNALVELARCACWFNPLAHIAATRLRADQELACDAAVVAAHPGARRSYARALLKAQLEPRALRLGCTWTSRSARQLAERIETLGRAAPSRGRVRAGIAAIAALGVCLGYAAWAQQPARLIAQAERPEPVWTPAAEAPPETLSHALEGQRHDFFIELAQAGDIELVFFGTTDTEMWWWERGRAVWEREFGALEAANFGSQGTQPRSLLWRMRNGELDGYQAKLIVLQAWRQPSAIPDLDDYVAGFVPIIGEVLARQPRAKLLIMAPLPRRGTIERWRQETAAYDTAMAGLADDETIFYANLGEGFFDADGAFKSETWQAGRQAPGFEIWAAALQPWLDRFVR